MCISERGREFQPGEDHDTLSEILGETRVDAPDVQLGMRAGLYDLRVNPEMNVFRKY